MIANGFNGLQVKASKGSPTTASCTLFGCHVTAPRTPTRYRTPLGVPRAGQVTPL